MGHVPSGTIPAKGHGPDLPGRQHRGTGAGRHPLRRSDLGALGEYLAGEFLRRRGGRILGHNLRTRAAEIDLVVVLDRMVVAVEVKTSRSLTDDPLEKLDDSQLLRIRSGGRTLHPPVTRVDAIGVTVGNDVRIRWLTRVA